MSHGMDDINIIREYEKEGKKCPLGNHLSGHFKNRGLKLQNCTLPDISRAGSPKRRGSWGGEADDDFSVKNRLRGKWYTRRKLARDGQDNQLTSG